ncbi:hypothetical protein Tco_0991672 [Tanacetum coccineum]|uniref:Uncharacterized protein n=1 Tax=Tanacetum coccineum TaxID=301880 RepID=A0ABQ5F0N8_9ASTR
MTDAKEIWEAIKSRFGGNDESKKMHKYILKQQFEGFYVSNLEGLHKGYDRFQSLLSQLEIHGVVDSLSFDDLYKKFKAFESDVKGSTASSSSIQNVAFVSENTSSTNDVSTTYGVSNSFGHNSQYEHTSSYSLLANQSICPQLDHKDQEQLDEFNLEEMDLKWQEYPGNQDSRRRDTWNTGKAYKENGRRSGKQEDSKALVTLDGEGVDWTSHSEDEQENYALMACSSSGSDIEREQLGDASIEIQAYTQALKKVDAQLFAHQQVNLVCGKDKMSAKDKDGLGYGDQMNKSVLSYENEVFQSMFVNRISDIEDSPVNDRYAEGMHAVPPPMTWIYIPSGPDKEIDDSQFTYGPKQSKPSESDARSSDFNSCESICSEETHESMPEPVCPIEPKLEKQEIPSFAFINTDKHVKTPRQTVIEQNTCSQSPKPDKKDCSSLMSKKLGLGFGYTKKACFVCGSFSHLIRDCDFHEKRMAKQAELNNRMSKGSSQREIRLVWNNVQRMNHQNQFVLKAVLTRTRKIPVNTVRTSGTNTVNTARHNFNRHAVPINAVRKVNTVKHIVNNARPKAGFHKFVSPFRKSFNRTATLRTNFSKQKVNTAEVNAFSVVKGKRETFVKSLVGCNWRPKRHYWNQVFKYNGGSNYPQRALQNKWIVDSGCSRHMTRNKVPPCLIFKTFNVALCAFGEVKVTNDVLQKNKEALVSREAWAHSMGLSSAVHYELQGYRTHVWTQDHRMDARDSLIAALTAQNNMPPRRSSATARAVAVAARAAAAAPMDKCYVEQIIRSTESPRNL